MHAVGEVAVSGHHHGPVLRLDLHKGVQVAANVDCVVTCRASQTTSGCKKSTASPGHSFLPQHSPSRTCALQSAPQDGRPYPVQDAVEAVDDRGLLLDVAIRAWRGVWQNAGIPA